MILSFQSDNIRKHHKKMYLNKKKIKKKNLKCENF